MYVPVAGSYGATAIGGGAGPGAAAGGDPGGCCGMILAGPRGVGVAFPVVAVVERHVAARRFRTTSRWVRAYRALVTHGVFVAPRTLNGRVLRDSAVEVAGRAVRIVLEGAAPAAAAPAGTQLCTAAAG